MILRGKETMNFQFIKLIPLLPYIIIFLLMVWSLIRKEKWIKSVLLALCFSSSTIIFQYFEKDLLIDKNFSVGLNAGMYASIVMTIPLAIYGWYLGSKENVKKVMIFSLLSLFLNFSVVKTYQYVVNKNSKKSIMEVAFDCQKLPFHCAIRDGKLESIIEFKKSGFNIEARDSLSRTPIWYAIANKKAVDLLLKNGANPDSFNIYGETPLAYTLVISLNPNLEIAQLLMDHGANINRSVGFRKKISILNFAIVNKNIAAINFALRNGANPNIPDDYKKTACQRLKFFEKDLIKDIEKYCNNKSS